MRTLVIGDIHGCRDELEDLLEVFGYVAGDRLFQTGDVVTRGPDTWGAVEMVSALGIRCVLGNQEARLLSTLRRPEATWSLRDREFLSRFQGHALEVALLVRNWPLWREEPDFVLVHAGLQPGVCHPRDMDPRVLLHVRTWGGPSGAFEDPANPAWFECDHWDKMTVFGHWADKGLVVRPGLRGLDTGCASGGRLSGWCPEEDRIYSVSARKAKCRLSLGGMDARGGAAAWIERAFGTSRAD